MKKRSSSREHKDKAHGKGPVSLAIVTVSDTRTEQTDANARYLSKNILKAGHRVESYHLIRDEAEQIQKVLEGIGSSGAQVVLFNGGTGISRRDRTFDVISRSLEKVLPGFGEIFRMLSYKQVGASAMLSRAVAGIYRDKVVISIPGSPQAVRLAWEKLIAPELEHLAWELTR